MACHQSNFQVPSLPSINLGHGVLSCPVPPICLAFITAHNIWQIVLKFNYVGREKNKWNRNQSTKFGVQKKQERLKRRNTLGCLDQYAAQNSKYAKPPIITTPNPKGLPVAHSIWSHHETFTLWNSLWQGAVPKAVLWIGSLPPNYFNLQISWSH